MKDNWLPLFLVLGLLSLGAHSPTSVLADAAGQADGIATGTVTDDPAAITGDDERRRHGRISAAIRAEVIESVTRAIENNPEISEADKQRILERMQDGRYLRNWDDDDGLGIPQFLIAVFAMLLVFGSPIILVAAILYAGHRKRRIASDTASQFLASGQPVPPEVWQGLAGDTSPRSNLHKGMIMLGAGLGIILCFWLMDNTTIAYLGLIPLFIGIALLLIWKLEKS